MAINRLRASAEEETERLSGLARLNALGGAAEEPTEDGADQGSKLSGLERLNALGSKPAAAQPAAQASPDPERWGMTLPTENEDTDAIEAQLGDYGGKLQAQNLILRGFEGQAKKLAAATQDRAAWANSLLEQGNTLAEQAAAGDQRSARLLTALSPYYDRAKAEYDQASGALEAVAKAAKPIIEENQATAAGYNASITRYNQARSKGKDKAAEYEKQAEELMSQARQLGEDVEGYEALHPSYRNVTPEQMGQYQQEAFALRSREQNLNEQARNLLEKAERERARYFSWQYDMVSASPDFAEKSMPDPEMMEQHPYTYGIMGAHTDLGYKDEDYAIINGSRDAYLQSVVDDEDKGYLRYLTDRQKQMYNYYYATEGKSKANQYIQEIKPALTKAEREKNREYWSEYASRQPWRATTFSVPISLMKVISYFGQAADFLQDGEIDPNAAYNKFSQIPGDIRNAVTQDIEKKWGKTGSFFYQIGMSMADFLFQSAITGEFAGAGAGLKGAAKFFRPSLAIMGTGAAADTVISLRDRGVDSTRAIALGTIAGLAEVVTENVSLETLLNPELLADGTIKYILKNMAAEGSEELGSDVINWAADALANLFTGRKQAEWDAQIKDYVKAGLSTREAAQRVTQDMVMQAALDAVGGALSGGVMAVGGTSYHQGNVRIAEARADKQMGRLIQENGDTDALIRQGLQTEGKSRQLAEMLLDKKSRGRTPGAADLQRLYDALTDAEKARADVRLIQNLTNESVENAQTLGNMETEEDQRAPGTETAETRSTLQAAVDKLASGEQLTQNDARRIMQDEAAMQTLLDAGVLTETIRNDAAGRQTVRRAVEQYAGQEAAAQDSRQETGLRLPAAETETGPAENTAGIRLPMAEEDTQEQNMETPARGLQLPTVTAEERAEESKRLELPGTEAKETQEAQGAGNQTEPLTGLARLNALGSERSTKETAQGQEPENQTAPQTTQESTGERPGDRTIQKALAQQRAKDAGKAVSLRDSGFTTASEDATTKIRAEENWDEEEKAVGKALRDMGYEPTFTIGIILNADGDSVPFLLEGNKLAVRADHRSQSIQAIAEQAIGRALDISANARNQAAEDINRAREAQRAQAAEENKPKISARAQRIIDSARAAGASKESGELAARLADVLNRDILFYNEAGKDGANTNGYTQDGVLYINAGADTRTVAWVVGHELTHNVEDSKYYAALKKLTKRELGLNWGLKVQSKINTAERVARKLGNDSIRLDNDGAEREVVADFFADRLLTDEASIRTVCEYEPVMARNIRDYIKNLLKKLGGKESTLERAVTLYNKALKDVAAKAKAAETKDNRKYSAELDVEYLDAVERGESEDTEPAEDSDDGSRQTPGTDALAKLGIRLAGSKGQYHLAEQLLERDKAAREIMKATKKAEKKLKATAKEREFAAGIAAGVYEERDIPSSMDKKTVITLADYYAAEDSFKANMLAEVRNRINAQYQAEAEDLLGDVESFKKLSMPALNERTPDRTFRAMFGEKQGKAIFDWLIRPVQMNEAEKTRWHQNQLDRVRTFKDSSGKSRELTREESKLTMLVMEGKAIAAAVADMEKKGEDAGRIKNAAENIRNGQDVGDTAQEFGLKSDERELAQNYARWMDTQELLKSADNKIIETAAKKYAEIFDEFYSAINDFLVAHGYEPIGYIKGYAPHMQPEETQSMLEKAFEKMGISLGNDTAQGLPASIAGETAYFKPNKRWDPYFLHRTGAKAEYDIVKAYQSYVGYLSDILFHTDDIMRVRNMEKMIRKTYAPDDITETIDHIKEIRKAPAEDRLGLLRDAGRIGKTTMLSTEEANAKLDEWEEEQFNALKEDRQYNNLVMWLSNYANILAGKQSYADRGWEYSLGRNSLNFANRLQAAFQRSLVAGSLSSALNQTAQLPQIKTELGDRWYYAALKDIITGKTKGFWRDSDFLTGKHGVDMLYTDNYEKFISDLFKPSTVVDDIVSTTAVRGAFLKAIHQGQSYSEAMQTADDFGRKVMGSREKGTRPLAYESKGLFSRMIHMFQVEAVNSWDHIVSDLPHEIKEISRRKGKAAAARTLAALIVKGLLSAFTLNRLTEEIYGGTPAPFDVIGLMLNFVASGEGMTTNQKLRTIIDNGLEKIGRNRVFGTEDTDAKFDVGKGLEELGYNVMNDVPLLRNLAGVLGLGDQTVPLPGAGGEFTDFFTAAGDLVKEGADGQQIENLIRAAVKLGAQFAPAGRQITKTAEGAEAAIRGGSYSKKGKLQYPIDTTWDQIRAILFGKNATNAAQEHWASGESTMTEGQTEMVNTMRGWGLTGTEAKRYLADINSFTADKDANGKTINGSQKAKVVEYIDGLDLTPSQKDALYLFKKYAESGLDDTPWHSGGKGRSRETTYAPASLSGLRLPTVESTTSRPSGGLKLPTA